MTELTRHVTRRVETRRGPRVVTLTEYGVAIRRPGQRESNAYALSYGALEDAAAKLHAPPLAPLRPRSKERRHA